MLPIRVDFYLLNGKETVDLFACRLLEKIYLKGHKIFVFCANQQKAEMIDELLWTFKEESFIPHNLQGEGPEPPPPIQIGFEQEPRGFNDILLNLSTEIPPFFGRFKRIIEIVTDDEEAKAISREHYKWYRAQQFHLHTHNIV